MIYHQSPDFTYTTGIFSYESKDQDRSVVSLGRLQKWPFFSQQQQQFFNPRFAPPRCQIWSRAPVIFSSDLASSGVNFLTNADGEMLSARWWTISSILWEKSGEKYHGNRYYWILFLFISGWWFQATPLKNMIISQWEGWHPIYDGQ